MGRSIRDNSIRDLNMDLVRLIGQMVLNMRVSGITIKSKAREFTNGMTVGSIQDLGSKINCMVRDSTPGPTEEVTKASINSTKSMAMEFSFGQTEKLIKDNGKRANSMAKDNLQINMVDRR